MKLYFIHLADFTLSCERLVVKLVMKTLLTRSRPYRQTEITVL